MQLSKTIIFFYLFSHSRSTFFASIRFSRLLHFSCEFMAIIFLIEYEIVFFSNQREVMQGFPLVKRIANELLDG